MTRLTGKLLILGLCAASVVADAAVAQDCKPVHSFETIVPGTLSVASFEFPPYAYNGEDGAFSGVDGEILKRIAAKECLEIDAKLVDPAAAIQYVLSNRADIAAGDWYRTAEREKVLGLTGPMYLDQMGIFTRDGATTIKSLEGRTVGVVQGYLWVADMQKVFGSSLKVYPNPVAMAQDLASGRIDAGTDSYAVGVAAQQKGGYPGIQIEVAEPDERVRATVQAGQTGFPFTKSNTALGEALSANIAAMHESGEIKEILTQFGLDPSAADVGAPRLVE